MIVYFEYLNLKFTVTDCVFNENITNCTVLKSLYQNIRISVPIPVTYKINKLLRDGVSCRIKIGLNTIYRM